MKLYIATENSNFSHKKAVDKSINGENTLKTLLIINS